MISDMTWPELRYEEWGETCATVHMWTQIVGKICLKLTPLTNHYWNAALQVAPRGLLTPSMPYGASAFSILFDFVDHRLVIACSDGATGGFGLAAMTVAEFYRRIRGELRRMGIDVKIWPMPVEIA